MSWLYAPASVVSNSGSSSQSPPPARVADRVDRLRACGNGVVPAVAARAWRELVGRI